MVALLYKVVHDEPRLDGVADPELRGLLAACMDKDPARRPTPQELLERFVPRAPAPEVLHGTGWLPEPVARRVADRTLALPSRSRRKVLAVGGVAGAGTLVAAVTGAVLLEGSGGRKAAARTTASPTPSAPPSPVLAQARWTVDLGADPYGGLASAGTTLVVSAEEGRLICLDVRRRKTVWQHRKGNRGDGAASWRTPVVADGTLFVGWPDAPGALYAFDVRNGDQRWSATMTDALNPAVSGGTLFVGDTGALSALSTSDGRVLWRASIGNALNATPAIGDGLVYAGTSDGASSGGTANALHALDARTGRDRWRHPMTRGAQSPAVSGGMVYCADGAGTMTALDARTGAKKWDFVGGRTASDPFMSGGLVYVADGDGKVYALDAATGRTRWTWPTGTGTGVWTAGIARGVVVVAAVSEVFGLDAAGGRPLWRTGQLDKVRTVAVQDDAVYVGIQAGTLLAFPVKGA